MLPLSVCIVALASGDALTRECFWIQKLLSLENSLRIGKSCLVPIFISSAYLFNRTMDVVIVTLSNAKADFIIVLAIVDEVIGKEGTPLFHF